MVDLRSSGSEQTCHRTLTTSQPKFKTQKIEALQNGRRKSAGSEGRGLETARHRFHKSGNVPRVVVQCHNCEEEKLEVANVYILHRPQQMLPEGRLSPRKNRQNCPFCRS
jgi:hypothetical protein